MIVVHRFFRLSRPKSKYAGIVGTVSGARERWVFEGPERGAVDGAEGGVVDGAERGVADGAEIQVVDGAERRVFVER